MQAISRVAVPTGCGAGRIASVLPASQAAGDYVREEAFSGSHTRVVSECRGRLEKDKRDCFKSTRGSGPVASRRYRHVYSLKLWPCCSSFTGDPARREIRTPQRVCVGLSGSVEPMLVAISLLHSLFRIFRLRHG
eukprot:2638632-Pyramimonas_sp.AAC.2